MLEVSFQVMLLGAVCIPAFAWMKKPVLRNILAAVVLLGCAAYLLWYFDASYFRDTVTIAINVAVTLVSLVLFYAFLLQVIGYGRQKRQMKQGKHTAGRKVGLHAAGMEAEAAKPVPENDKGWQIDERPEIEISALDEYIWPHGAEDDTRVYMPGNAAPTGIGHEHDRDLDFEQREEFLLQPDMPDDQAEPDKEAQEVTLETDTLSDQNVFDENMLKQQTEDNSLIVETIPAAEADTLENRTDDELQETNILSNQDVLEDISEQPADNEPTADEAAIAGSMFDAKSDTLDEQIESDEEAQDEQPEQQAEDESLVAEAASATEMDTIDVSDDTEYTGEEPDVAEPVPVVDDNALPIDDLQTDALVQPDEVLTDGQDEALTAIPMIEEISSDTELQETESKADTFAGDILEPTAEEPQTVEPDKSDEQPDVKAMEAERKETALHASLTPQKQQLIVNIPVSLPMTVINTDTADADMLGRPAEDEAMPDVESGDVPNEQPTSDDITIYKQEFDGLRAMISDGEYHAAADKVFELLDAGYDLPESEKQRMKILLRLLDEKCN